ncbi:AMIN-like domain-containing (lipo)protein [Lentzea sp.]|uniref:AMIN-like domain-containing (lipo)protein n=1 Tax=Lentzea sp. TaxID=56099 RepID=UPI002ED2A027
MKKSLTAALFAVLAVFAAAPVASADSNAHLTDIVTSKHDGFERVELVVDRLPTQSFADEVTEVWDCARDVRIPVGGQKFLRTTHFSASTRDSGKLTYTGPRNFVPQGLTNVKGIAISCDFESTLGVSVGYDNPGSTYQVYSLTNPSRVVIDVRG